MEHAFDQRKDWEEILSQRKREIEQARDKQAAFSDLSRRVCAIELAQQAGRPSSACGRVEWVITLLDGDKLALRRVVNGRVDESYAPKSPEHLLEMVADVVAGYSPAGYGMTRRTERQDVLSWPAEVIQSPPGT